MGVLSSNSLALSYTDSGTGPAVVFQHGLGGSAAQPASQAPRRCRVITLECRGHGSSPLGPEPELCFETFADDLRTLLDDLSVESAVIAGISMGAGVALNFAQRHPVRVRGLALVRPAWRDRPRPPNLHVFEEIARCIRTFGPEAGKAAFLEHQTSLYPDIPRTAQRSLVAQFDREGAYAHVAVLERLVNDQPFARPARELQHLTFPTIVVGNHDDPVHPISHAAWFADQLGPTNFVTVPARADDVAHRAAISSVLSDFVDLLHTPEAAPGSAMQHHHATKDAQELTNARPR
jgi:pimeloyl-ACP methyl ester carboxylesterase